MGPNPEQTLCGIKAEIISGTFPSKQNILDALRIKLEDLLDDPNPTTFSNNYQFQFTIGAVIVTITVYMHQNPD
jgi:hypothetical protein